MTDFNYNTGIPAANNNPSVDQNPMLENFTSINQLLGVDHVTFNTANGGEHLQVTYNNITAPSSPTDPMSISFTKNDTIGHPNNYFINSQATFMLSAVKAFGSFNTGSGSGSISYLNQYNCSGSISASAFVFTITLNANIVNGTNYVLMAMNNNRNNVVSTSIISSTSFTISLGAASNIVSFLILQA